MFLNLQKEVFYFVDEAKSQWYIYWARFSGRTLRMLSSAGEHRPYKAGVTGSNPVASTTLK